MSIYLEKIDAAYWQQQLGSSKPKPIQVLSLLCLQSHWGDEAEGGIDIFDFALPGDVSNYVLSVRFNKDGCITNISMES